jgi:hypothetical protein
MRSFPDLRGPERSIGDPPAESKKALGFVKENFYLSAVKKRTLSTLSLGELLVSC